MNRKVLGTLIVVGAVAVLVFTFGRAMYYSPGSEDAGLPGAVVAAGVITGEAGEDSTSPDYAENSQSKPVTLEIPKIGVVAKSQDLGITSEGLMAVPSNFTDVGWYKYGTVPGNVGSAVIAGHQDNAMGTPAVFFELDKLKIGDSVYVVREDGKKLQFKVYKTELLPYDLKGPKLENIFNGKGGKYLNIITCAGKWLPSAKTNDLRLIVYTELVE